MQVAVLVVLVAVLIMVPILLTRRHVEMVFPVVEQITFAAERCFLTIEQVAALYEVPNRVFVSTLLTGG